LALPRDFLSWLERRELDWARQFELNKLAAELAIQLEADLTLPRKLAKSDDPADLRVPVGR
jgi:hypothetical protein